MMGEQSAPKQRRHRKGEEEEQRPAERRGGGEEEMDGVAGEKVKDEGKVRGGERDEAGRGTRGREGGVRS